MEYIDMPHVKSERNYQIKSRLHGKEYRCKELVVTQKEQNLLFAISPATVDCLLKPERRKLEIKRTSGTKPGTLLKNQIPIKIFTPWNEQMPGFIEMDLVAHCGDTLRGSISIHLMALILQQIGAKNKGLWVRESMQQR